MKTILSISKNMILVALTLISINILPPSSGAETRPDPQRNGNRNQQGRPSANTGQRQEYSIEQAVSDTAQLHTIAFSGLAFLTGTLGADSFFPPGKVADFFGFQYMRDVDTAGYGHNTTFLTRVASNVLNILNDSQKAKLISLAKEQAPLYSNFAYNRLCLIKAFRRNLEGSIPSGSKGLSVQAVSDYTASLYKIDADLSYSRALVIGGIINSFTSDQKAYLAKMKFNDYSSWPEVPEDNALKRGINNNEFVAVMTYASELFSWYKGSPDADVYFCPERHGTYFGGFYMKDYPAMNNPSYFISTSTTGDSGKDFLNILNSDQRALITGIIEEQRAALSEIVGVRKDVAAELRKAITGGAIDKEKVYRLIMHYGELDGQLSALYTSRFSAVNKTLTETQRASLVKLRNLDVVPHGAYRFSTPVPMPEISDTDFLFGAGSPPQDAGQTTAPASFSNSNEPSRPENKDRPGRTERKPSGDSELMQKGSTFVLTTPEVIDGGMLPKEYTCDGSSATLPLEWSGVPSGTKSLAVVMHTIPGPNESHWYWVLYNIPADTKALAKNVTGIGNFGNNSINGKTEYAPPCSKGPGPKLYTYTIYALSAPPQFDVPASQVSRDILLSAIKDRTLDTAELNVYYSLQGKE
jgi:phosphatidylethanolamine-binding protein (PEBP) family uncharacterized protein